MRLPWGLGAGQKADWNALRFPGRGADHVESYFVKGVSPEADRALWLKATIYSCATEPERAVTEGWAIVWDHRGPSHRRQAVKHSVPLDAARLEHDRLGVAWDDAQSGSFLRLDAERSEGRIVAPSGTVSWELGLSGPADPLVLFPSRLMYDGPLPTSKTVTPQPDALLHGQLTLGDERWEIAAWRGMQGHNWGTGHAEQYAWVHCNQWSEPSELVLEAVTARVRLGPALSPPLSAACVRYRGVDHPFHGPIAMLATRADVGTRRYSFSASSRGATLEGVFEAATEDLVGLYYDNPRGQPTHCLNSKLARGRLRLALPGQPVVSLSTQAAALELGTRRVDHGVRMHA